MAEASWSFMAAEGEVEEVAFLSELMSREGSRRRSSEGDFQRQKLWVMLKSDDVSEGHQRDFK